jgi:hypothetical protein
MSAPTGNFRGQRTQSSSNGYKTIGSSIASGSNGGCFKRIFINALGNTNGNYDLAFTKTLGIPRNYYNSTSNNSNYQEPTLSGKTRQVVTVPTAISLTQVSQTATVQNSLTCYSSFNTLSQLAITSGSTSPQMPFTVSNYGSSEYFGNLNYFSFEINSTLLIQPPDVSPSTNTYVLTVTVDNANQATGNYNNFGSYPVVLNGGEIILRINNDNFNYSGKYCISGSAGSCGGGTLINSVNQSNYTQFLNTFFPGGLYFNLPNCSS